MKKNSPAYWPPRLLLILLLALPGPISAQAQTPDAAAGKKMLRQFAGSDDWSALFSHPKVQPQLKALLGTELGHLRNNLDVSGAVDVTGGDLSINGNAPHQGTEEEGVVCVSSYNMEVSAAIFSKGTVTVYSREKMYENLSRCIKDWVTEVNSEHRDRMSQPKNVKIANVK